MCQRCETVAHEKASEPYVLTVALGKDAKQAPGVVAISAVCVGHLVIEVEIDEPLPDGFGAIELMDAGGQQVVRATHPSHFTVFGWPPDLGAATYGFHLEDVACKWDPNLQLEVTVNPEWAKDDAFRSFDGFGLPEVSAFVTLDGRRTYLNEPE